MSDISPWLASIFISKLLLYITFAMSVGGVSAALMIQQYQFKKTPFLSYALTGVVLGLVFSSIDFLLQVGSFAESGFSGMWDKMYMEILWQSGVGITYKLRLAGGFGLLVLLIAIRFKSVLTKPVAYTYLAVSLLIAASFTWIGHTAEQATWVRSALVLHIFIAMWWVGFLYPLRVCCQALTGDELKKLMHEFGKQASYLVALLLVAGVAISYVLEGSFTTLFTSTHGNILLVKLGAVAAILAIAAYHKLRLVPSLTDHQSALTLKRSISIEMGIALLILIITAALSTLAGPSHI